MSDLAENRRRQNELAEKAKMLKQEEALLMDILKLTERYEETNPSPEPPPRHQPPSRPEQLRELLVELLGTHDQPRSARALRDELRQRHPDRAPTPQVVRNALESLVAKGRIRRHKQERAVSYSLSGSGRAVG